MKTINYTVKDQIGIHARPASLLVKKAAEYESTITVAKGEKEVKVTNLMSIMGLSVQCGDVVTLKIEGRDEDSAYSEIEAWLASNL